MGTILFVVTIDVTITQCISKLVIQENFTEH